MARTYRHELFLLTVVTLCFGTAFVTGLFGISLALGAFLAGLVVSESPYAEHTLSEILPLRTVFNAMFFMSVGMLLDVRFVLAHPWLVLGIALFIALLKALVTGGSVLALGYGRVWPPSSGSGWRRSESFPSCWNGWVAKWAYSRWDVRTATHCSSPRRCC